MDGLMASERVKRVTVVSRRPAKRADVQPNLMDLRATRLGAVSQWGAKPGCCPSEQAASL